MTTSGICMFLVRIAKVEPQELEPDPAVIKPIIRRLVRCPPEICELSNEKCIECLMVYAILYALVVTELGAPAA